MADQRVYFKRSQFRSYPVWINPPPMPDPEASLSDWEAGRLAVHAYVDGVADALETIDRPGVGRIVLEGLPSTGTDGRPLEVWITPRKKGITQAVPLNDADATAKGTQLGAGSLFPKTGTGLGSSSVIFFNPDEDRVSCIVRQDPAAACTGLESDEILVHELMHALREMGGRENKIAFDMPDQRYDDTEEFYAILVANIYMSERGETSLVKDHHDFVHALQASWSTSSGFLTNGENQRWVSQFCLMEQPALARRIKDVAAPFNPIREFLNQMP